ncbi:MAG: tol-pal system protein YbgF [Parvibaculales bacterium]
MFEPMKNFVLMACLGLASVWPNIVAAQEAPAPDMAGEVPIIEVPVIEAPLTPLTPSPYGSGDGGDAVSGTQNSMAALQAKITELEQRMTADRTLMMRQQMTRLRTIDERLEEMAVQIGELGIRPTGEAGVSNTSIPAPIQTDDAFADPAEAAGMRLRLSTIEENLRQVSGQTAELVQSLDKLMQQVETVRQDNEFRFQQIEGSLGRAARDPDDMPSEAPEVLGQIRMATPVEKLDAPVSEGDASIALIGEGDLPMQNPAAEAAIRPALNDPKDLYERALADLRAGAYAGAQTDFEQMLKRFPAHKLAGNAQYWLGETFYVRRQFKQAAEAFLAGYTTYQQSTKAPDSLLKLGMTLAAMGEKKTSCDAFKELAVKFPQAPQAIAKRVQIEKARVGCAS